MKNKGFVLIMLILTLVITGCTGAESEPDKLVKDTNKNFIPLEEMADLYNEPDKFKGMTVRGVGIVSTVDRDENMFGIISNNKYSHNVIVIKFDKDDLESPILFKDDIIHFEGHVLNKLDIDGDVVPFIDAHYIEKIDLDQFKTQVEETTQEETEDTEEDPEDIEKEPEIKEPTTLFSGTWTVGDDIAPGSYIVTCKGLGNFTVYDNDENLITSEILSDSEKDHVVTKIKIELEDGYKIKLRSMQEVYFTPN